MRNCLKNSDKLSIKGKATARPVCLFGQYIIRGIIGSEAQGGVHAIMCGGSACVDDNGVRVVMCLSDVWSEAILDPLMNSVFVSFLGVVKIDVDMIFEYVDNLIAGLAFCVSWVVGVAYGIGCGLVGKMWERGYGAKGCVILCSLWDGEGRVKHGVWRVVCVFVLG